MAKLQLEAGSGANRTHSTATRQKQTNLVIISLEISSTHTTTKDNELAQVY
jgi:hypothetical protein